MARRDDTRAHLLARLHGNLADIRASMATTQARLDAGEFGPRRTRKTKRYLARVQLMADQLERELMPVAARRAPPR